VLEDCCSEERLLLQQGTHSTSADGLPKRTKDYIVLATISFRKQKQTKQEREKQNSLSLSLSLTSQFLKTLLAAAFEASSARKLAATTITNKSKLTTRSPALPSLALSLSALLLLPRLLGNPRLGNGDWYTWEESHERPLNPSQV
jgi:hypothetical protein